MIHALSQILRSPKKYGLRQTIADTLGVGGVFRALRTIPVMLDPHASAELSIDDIVAMCDEMIEAHGSWMPEYS